MHIGNMLHGGLGMTSKTQFHTSNLVIAFYETDQGSVPVQEWLRNLEPKVKKHIGTELMKIQFGWPVGPPVCKKLRGDVWEFITAMDGIAYRILFAFYGNSTIVLLHSFIKKAQKTPKKDIECAEKRLALLQAQ